MRGDAVKPCAICGRPAGTRQKNETPICQECIETFKRNRERAMDGEKICLICGSHDLHGKKRSYCCSEHRHFGSIIEARENCQIKHDKDKIRAVRKNRRAADVHQRHIDEVNARARAAGRSYGKQKMIELGMMSDERRRNT